MAVLRGIPSRPGADLASSVPEILTMNVDLPVEVHEAPEDEQTVALDDVAISPHTAETDVVGTTSVEVIPELVLAAAEQAALEQAALDRAAAGEDAEAETPPLPEVVAPTSRHARRFDKAPDPIRWEGVIPPRSGSDAPEGFWPEFVYGITLTLVNIGDAAPVRARKALDARIQTPLEDGAHFVPVVSRQGGVGATTITALLGMAIAELRDDGVLAIDAHPDRGTLAERIEGDAPASVRDVVHHAPRIREQDDMAEHVLRDRTSLEVVGSEEDAAAADPFDRNDYNVVADVAARFYTTVLTDGASGVREPIMREALQRAEQLVLVTGGGADEARRAAEALDWLEANGHAELAAATVLAVNTATTGTALDRLDEIEAHFRPRVRAIVRIPYDEELAAGTPIRFGALRPFTREAARDLAALVIDGLPAAPAPSEPAASSSASDEPASPALGDQPEVTA